MVSARAAWLMVSLTVPVLLLASEARADIYKHVDKDGVVHLTNRTARGKRVAREAGNGPVVSASGQAAQTEPNSTRYDHLIREAAALYQIPEALVRAVIRVESGFHARAVSHANAHGLMQLIPETAGRMMVTDIFDPRQNILGGTRYLRVLANLFNGNLELTLAAYNAGENAVIRYGGIPPYAETRQYVAKVLSHYHAYRGYGAGRAQ